MADRETNLRVLVADDSTEFLSAICAWIGSQSGMRVVGTARNGEEAVAKVTELRPDLVLMDAFMPVMDGFEATRRIKRRDLAPWVVVVSLHEDSAVRDESWVAGADAFAGKSELTGRLPEILGSLTSESAGPRDGGPAGGSGGERKRSTAGRRPSAKRSNGIVERVSLGPGRIHSLFRNLVATCRSACATLANAWWAGGPPVVPLVFVPKNDRAPLCRVAMMRHDRNRGAASYGKEGETQ
jgi:CheY-like chemotaxis protein